GHLSGVRRGGEGGQAGAAEGTPCAPLHELRKGRHTRHLSRGAVLALHPGSPEGGSMQDARRRLNTDRAGRGAALVGLAASSLALLAGGGPSKARTRVTLGTLTPVPD